MMHISIDTSQELTDGEKAVLRALIGDAPSKAVAEPTEDKPAPRKRAATKPKPAPEPELDEDDDDDEVNTEEANDRPAPKKRAAAKPKADGGLRAKVTETVTDLVASGQAKKVKAALADLGVAKASELDEDQLQDFLDSLDED